MAHIPYVDLGDLGDPTATALVNRIVAERGSVLHLYQMLLHSPSLAAGWLTFLTAIRQKLELAGSLRELVIIRIAILNGASYEAEQHIPIALAEGMSQEQVDALADWEKATVFDKVQRLALELTDAITRDVAAPPHLVGEARDALGARQCVELVATIAAYNMVSRFLESFHIHSTDARP